MVRLIYVVLGLPECPYCGRWFRTKRGLKTHIAKVHMVDDGFGGRVLNPFSIDLLGAAERRMKRKRKRRKGFSLW